MPASGRGEEVRIRCLKKLSYSITAGPPCMKIAPIPRVPHSCSLTVQSPYILYTLLSGHSLHQRGVLDGLDGEECAGSASGVRDTSQPRRGVERFVPGVRDHAADRLSVAAAFSTTGRGGDGGAEPASARESA